MKSPVFLALFLFGLTAGGPPPASAIPEKGTFFEEILDLQTDKIRTVKPSSGNVSIPYTRIDVAIENGIAVTRFLQTYHNHGSRNEGYAFQIPLNDDTTISRFVLWDRGVRYVAGIEERTRAEEVYRQVTGDEAPEMNRDPGLVRRTRNRYEMRVFPILPGETKQVELISHERLGMESGAFTLDLPLGMMTGRRDWRQPGAESGLTEVSIFIRDDLRIETASLEGVPMNSTKWDDHRWLLTARLGPGGIHDTRFRYRIRLETPTAVTPVTFAQDVQHYISMRVLYQPAAAKPIVPPPRPPQNFYIGVWRSREKPIAIGKNESDWSEIQKRSSEAFAGLTLLMMDRDDAFHGSYRPPGVKALRNDEVPWHDANFLRLLSSTHVTPRLLHVREFRNIDNLIPQCLAFGCHSLDLIDHLRGAIRNDDCRNVYLFFDRFSDRVEARLFELMREHPDVRFFMVTRDGALPALMTRLKNVNHFSMQDGWKINRQPSDRSRLLSFQESDLATLSGWLGIKSDRLIGFWENLPNLGSQAPTLRWSGDIRFDDFEVFRGETHHQKEAQPDDVHILWLAGRYEGSGHARLELRLGENPFPFDADSDEKPLVIRAETEVPDGQPGHRFVASFHARQKADQHCARIEMLRGSIRSLSGKPHGAEQVKVLQEKLAQHRAEVVRLSRAFSFITPETAFIALPPELQRQYDLTPREYAAQQVYDFAGMRSGGTPEPQEWLLLLLGISMALYFTRKSWRQPLPHRSA